MFFVNFAKFVRTCFYKEDCQNIGITLRLTKSNIKNYVENEIKKDFLGDLIYLYVKTRTFLLVNSELDTLFSKKQNQSTYNIKKIAMPLKAP